MPIRKEFTLRIVGDPKLPLLLLLLPRLLIIIGVWNLTTAKIFTLSVFQLVNGLLLFIK